MSFRIPAKQFQQYLERYALSHQNPKNVIIHSICVPLIAFSLLGLVWAIPMPHLDFLGKMNGYINLATFLIVFATVYYLRLRFKIGLAMIFSIWVFSAGIITLERMARLHGWPEMWQVCLVIFVLAWIGQFIGHKIEGKKPSFLEDLQFLLIGPAWLWAKIFQKLGWQY